MSKSYKVVEENKKVAQPYIIIN